MTLPAAFASIAQSMASALGAPFYAGKVIIDGTPGGYDDNGVFQPGTEPSEIDCTCQIDQVSDYMRAQGGFTDRDYRFILLSGGFDGTINTDARVRVTDPNAPADFRVEWMVSALQRDPAGIGWTGKGRAS
jgi:hypothetical protein